MIGLASFRASLRHFARRQVARGALRPRADDPRGPPSLADLLSAPEPFVRAALRGIRDGSYRPAPARVVTVVADKPRRIPRFTWLDELILVDLGRTLQALVEPQLPESVWSFRPGRGQHRALRVLGAHLRARPTTTWWGLKRDVKNYGESLRHDVVLADLERFCAPTPELRHLVQVFSAYRFIDDDGAVVTNTVGLPTGSFFQLVFENLAFVELDRRLEAIPGAVHLRFGDDILFATPERAVRDEAALALHAYATARGLTLKVEKAVDFALVRPHLIPAHRTDGARAVVPHLGVHVRHDGATRLAKAKIRRLTTYLLERLGAALEVLPSTSHDGRLQVLIGCVRRLFESDALRARNPVIALVRLIDDEQQLRELDRWIALTVVRLAVGGAHKRSLFNQVSYRRLRALGLPSLVHLRRRGALR